MSTKKSIREQAIEKLLSHVIQLGEKSMIKMEYAILTEFLVNGKKLGELTATPLTAHRQRQIFDRAFVRLIRVIDKADLKLRSEENLDRELAEARNRIKTLEAEIDRQNGITPKLKALLSLPIVETKLSARVKGICSNAGIRRIEQLITLSRNGFLLSRNCGKLSADEVEAFLESKGLSWNMKI